MTRQDIKARARETLANARGASAGALLLSALILSVGGSLTFGIGLIASPLLVVALAGYFLRVYRGETPGVGGFLSDCLTNAGRRLGGMWWMTLRVFVCFLGSFAVMLLGALVALPEWLAAPVMLLCMVPGFVKAYSYILTPFILYDCPNVSAKDAVRLSARMAEGFRMDIFVAQLSFIGWFFLSAITAQIVGVCHAYPYCALTMAGIYQELKKRAVEDGAVTYAMLDGTQPVQ